LEFAPVQWNSAALMLENEKIMRIQVRDGKIKRFMFLVFLEVRICFITQMTQILRISSV
jgi:hypothetical protein